LLFVNMFKKVHNRDSSNFRGISLVLTTYKILSNILLSRLASYADDIIGDNRRGYRRNGSTTDHIFNTRQILEKKWEYNQVVHQLFIGFKTAYYSIKREVLYNILIDFSIPLKLVRLIKMCLTKKYSTVRVGKNLSEMFPIRNSSKKRRCYIAIAFQLCFRVRY
jgi:hypothetical protein